METINAERWQNHLAPLGISILLFPVSLPSIIQNKTVTLGHVS